MRSPAAPRRPLNPKLREHIDRSGVAKKTLVEVSGFRHHVTFYNTLRAATVPATPLMVHRLEWLAAAVDFPRHEIFLDEAAQ